MLGIVILNYKTYNETLRCVKTIQATVTTTDYKIIVVDNASPNDSFNILSKEYEENEKVICYLASENNGFSAGNNIGAKIAIENDCDALLFCNSDIEYYNNTIDVLYKFINDNKDVAIAAPLIVNDDGSIRNEVRKRIGFYTWICHTKPYFKQLLGKNSDKKVYDTKFDYKTEKKYIGVPPGCCFIVRAETFLSLGGLDENVFLYFEEDILCEKIYKKGLLVAIVPSVKTLHFGQASTGSGLFSFYNLLKSELYYFRAYKGISKLQLKILYELGKRMLKAYSKENNYDQFVNEYTEKYNEMKGKKRKYMLK